MKVRFVAIVACAMALCLALVGCGGVDKSNYLGTWELESTNVEDLDAASIKLAKSLDSNMELTLQEDGTGALYLFSELSSVEWEPETETEATATIDGEDATITVSGSELTLSDSSGRVLKFSHN